MNYTQTHYNGGYRLGTRLLALGLATVLAGCATVGSVDRVSKRVEGLEGRMPVVERKVETVETKPNAERTLALKEGCKIDGNVVDHLYNWLRGRVIPKYTNPEARADVEANADMYTLGPTGVAGVYRSVPIQDADGNCKPSKGDFVFPDVVGGKERVGVEVPKGELSEELKALLLEVVGGKK